MTEITKTEPDIEGRHGCAWEFSLASPRPVARATLKMWIVSAPFAHPYWQNYFIDVIHLRPLEGFRATLYDPRATHEVLVAALHPRRPIEQGHRPDYQLPLNYNEQFMAPDDVSAVQYVEGVVREICQGMLSPDTDYWRDWFVRFPFINPNRRRRLHMEA